jgi:ankyrin repeat protein
MHLTEIAEVIAIDFDASPRRYDPRRRLINPAKFFHKYSNLVSIFTIKAKYVQHQELRLAHLSVRDYLLSRKILGTPVAYFAISSLSAHRSIAETCLVYLQQFEKPVDLTSNPPERYSLARYAARFWSYHVQAVSVVAEQRFPISESSKFSGLDGTNPLISLIIEFLLQVLKVFSLSSTSSQVTELPIDLNQLCVGLLSSQGGQLQSQIRFFDPDTPWIEAPDIARAVNTLPSALYYAAHAGLTDSVKLLLAKGIDVNATGGRYGSALQAASCKGYRDVVALLIENGADVNLQGGDYGYALQGACCYGHETCAKILLDHGANVNAKGGEHSTALHAAAFNGYESVVALLVQNGAEIDSRDDQMRTPLIEAAAEGHTATVELLLKLGANAMLKDDGGWTALDESAPPGFDAIVRMLIEHNEAILESRDKMDFSALHHTAGQHHESTVQLLLEMGMDVNSKNDSGRSALYQATKSGDEAVVQLFLKHGADIQSKDRDGWTVLHLAAFHGHVEIGELLLEHGANINWGPEGWTPLHIAVLRKNIDFVELLLELEADISRTNDDGLTALDCIALHEEGKAEMVLRRLNIDSHFLTTTGLRLAAAKGHNARIRELLERGADINAKDEGGMTALLWAACEGFTSTVRLLVENGADVNARDDGGMSVMTYLGEAGGKDLNTLILEHGFHEEQSSAGVGFDWKLIGELTAEDRRVLDEMRDCFGSQLPFMV